MKRVMLFYDLENFKRVLDRRDSHRTYDFGKAQYTIIDLIKRQIGINVSAEDIVRTYAYTGAYGNDIMSRMKHEISILKADEKKRKESFLDYIEKQYAEQQKFFSKALEYNSFELRTYPLKYEYGKVFQKGVDVQLAVDFVTHAFRDNFDIAVVASGDIDLLESLKTVKSLGKKVVVMGHPAHTSLELRRESDFFIDISRLTTNELNGFSTKHRPPAPRKVEAVKKDEQTKEEATPLPEATIKKEAAKVEPKTEPMKKVDPSKVKEVESVKEPVVKEEKPKRAPRKKGVLEKLADKVLKKD
ncbi:NYN domain-containing protein [Candidatus Woesearchaeota archaeon]|nr:NYN domain-containing protein [Candidatus Woesearchaeota archaeon]